MSGPGAWRRRAGLVTRLALGIIACASLLPSAAEAFQVKRVIRGSATLAAGTEALAVDLSALDTSLTTDPLVMSKTVVLSSGSLGGTNANSLRAFGPMVVLDDDKSLLLSRVFATNAAADVEFMVVEFAAGVNVISGITMLSEVTTGTCGTGTACNKTVTLPQGVNLSRAFPIITTKLGNQLNNSETERYFLTAELTAVDKLNLRRGDALNANLEVYYQVVDFTGDVNVTHGAVTINNSAINTDCAVSTDNGQTVTCDFSPTVTTAKTMLVQTFRLDAAAAGNGLYQANGRLLDNNTLEFKRSAGTGTTTTTDIVWYLIEFTNEAFVKSNATAESVTSTGTAQNVSLSPDSFVLSRSFGVHSNSGVSGAGTTMEEYLVRGRLTTATNYAFTRGTTATATPGVETFWFAVELPPVDVTYPNGGQTVKVGDPVTITWDYAKGITGDNFGAHTAVVEVSPNGTTWYAAGCTCTGGTCELSDNSCAWSAVPESFNPGPFNAIGTTWKVRVTDSVIGGRNFDASNANFTIRGTISNVRPENGGGPISVLNVSATDVSIKWNHTGLIGNVDIILDRNRNGVLESDGSTLADDPPLNGSAVAGTADTWAWNPVPDLVNTGYKVWVDEKAATDPTGLVQGVSSVFEIRPSITVVRPLLSSDPKGKWPAGRCRTIQWTTTGTVTSVDISYYKQSAGGYTTIVSSLGACGIAPCYYTGVPAENTGCELTDPMYPSTSLNACLNGKKCYDWTLDPAIARGTDFRIKITMTGNASVAHETPVSPDFFTVLGSVDVREPNAAGVVWTVGPPSADVGPASRDIKFDIAGGAGVDKVDVFLVRNYVDSTNPACPPTGADCIQIADDMDVTTCRNFAYPSASGCKVTWADIPVGALNAATRVKIKDFASGNVYDYSDNNLNVVGGIALTAPIASEIVRIGSSYNVTWTNHGDIFTSHCGGANCLEVRLATDGSSFGTVLASGRDSAAGSGKIYSWTPADALAPGLDTNKLRVMVPSSTTVLGTSAAFKVRPLLKLLNPGNASGQIFTAQDPITVTWDTQPATGLGGTVTLKRDTSSGSGGYGTTITCTDTVGDAAGAIEAADKQCGWPGAQTDVLSSTLKLKLELDSQPADVNVVSAFDFRIKGQLTLGYPSASGGSALTWLIDNAIPQPITWTYKGATMGKVKGYYSIDGGSSYPGVIFDENANAGAGVDVTAGGTGVNWTVPLGALNAAPTQTLKEINPNVKVRLVGHVAASADVESISTQPITIKAQFTGLTVSNSGTWTRGESQNLSWVTKGDGLGSGTINCLYSTDGSTFSAFRSALSNIGSCTWNPVNGTVSNAITYRVESATNPWHAVNPYIALDSAGGNTIKAKITAFTSPLATDIDASAWRVGASRTVTWTADGDPGTVRVFFSPTGTFPATTPWDTAIFTAVSGSGGTTASWTVPDTIDANPALNDEKFRIECETAWKCDALNSSGFNVKGSLTMLNNTGPYTAETGLIPIKWKYAGTVGSNGKVSIDFENNGAFVTTVVSAWDYNKNGTNGTPGTACAGTDADPCTYNWTTPTNVGTQFRFRVKADTDPTFTQSAQTTDFAIQGTLTMLTPQIGGSAETWYIGDNKTLTWDAKGALGNVTLSYTFNGTTFTDITTTTAAGAETYSWNPLPNNVLGPDGEASTPTFQIKIVSNTYPSVSSISTQAITVKAKLASLALTGGSTWVYGDTGKGLSWTTLGDGINDVRCQYSTDGTNFTDFATVALAGSGASSCTWSPTVNGPISNTVTYRAISSANYPNGPVVTSAGGNTLKGKLTINNPAGGATWIANTANQAITWAPAGAIPGAIDIWFAADGVTWGSPITCTDTVGDATGAVEAADATCNWPSVANAVDVATPNPADEKVKIACSGATSWACDEVIMPTAFNIKGQLTVQNNAGPYNAATGTIPIRWTYRGNVGNIVLKYDTNNGGGTDGNPSTDADDFQNTITTTPNPLPVNYNACAEGATCQYDWSTPATTGAGYRLQISPAEDTAAVVEQTTSFTIKGSVTLTRPTGTGGQAGMVWKVGETTQTIDWSYTGALGNINIKYDKDGSNTFPVTIATVAAGAPPSGTGSYTWSAGVPIAALNGLDKNNQFKIKLEQVTDTTTNSQTTTPIWVVSQVAAGAGWPTGSQTWYSGESKSVAWTNTNANVGTVLVKYSTDGGVTYPNLLTPVAIANTGSYGPFTVNIPVDDDIRLRVESADSTNTGSAASDVFLASAGNFTVKGKITNIVPSSADVGASALRVGNTKTITWSASGAMGTVKISYDNGPGTFATTIRTAVNPADQSCCTGPAWTVPDQIPGGADNRIRIECETNLPTLGIPKCEATDSSLFEIRGQLTLAEPWGGEVYYVGGADIPIKWTYKGTLGNMELRSDNNSGGNGYLTLINTVVYNYPGGASPCAEGATCTYNWPVPAAAGTKYRVKILPLSDAGLAVTSNSDFVIKGAVTLNSPGRNPGSPEVWTVNGTGNSISWTATGGIKVVDLLLSTNGGADGYATTIIGRCNSDASGAGCTPSPDVCGCTSPYTWTIPSGSYGSVTTNAAKVRVRDSNDGTVYHSSTNDFYIKPRLLLQAPNNNSANVVVGQSYSVTWDPAQQLGSVGSLKINFSTNGGKGLNGTLGDGDDWPDTDCVANLSACVTNKGGLITSSVAVAAGSASWTVPDIMTNEGVARITKAGDAAPVAADASDSYYFIKGSVTNVQIKNNAGDAPPASPIDLPIDTDKWITFDYSGSLGTVNIYYATDGNLGSPTWTLIPDPDGAGARTSGANVPVTGGAGSYQWRIPNAPSPNVRVKVEATNANWQTVAGMSPGSPNLNSIIGSIAGVTVIPDGTPSTTNLEVTGSKTIQWTPNGAIALFKIEYRCTGGNPACNGTWIDITTPPTGTTGTTVGSDRQWVWSGIPDRISNDVDFRVSDYNDPNKVKGESSVNYILKGKLSVVSPVSTDVWTIGTTYSPSIRWNKQGTIGDLKVEYSTSGTFNAGDYSSGYVFTIVNNYASGADGNNDYAWPAGVIGATRKISDTGAIRISNITAVTGTELAATHAGTFKIRPSLTTISSPTSISRWYVGTTDRVITWVCNSGTKGDGTLPKVIIQYNADGGTFNNVAGAGSLDCVDGTNNYTWPSIPDERTNNATVKISFVDYTSLNIVSPAFDIHPIISIPVILNPNAGPNQNTDKFPVGTTYTNLIKWSRSGTKSVSFKVLYATDGSTFTDPANRIPDGTTLHTVTNGSTGVTWDIPATMTLSPTAKIRIIDADFPDVTSDSSTVKLIGGITGITPAGSGTTLIAGGATNTISWNFTGGVGLMNAYYSLNGTSGPWTLISSYNPGVATSGTGTVNFDMSPTGKNVMTATNAARIKVTDADDEANVYAEGADFKIGLTYEVTAPETNAVVCKAEESCPVTWTWTPAAGGGVTDVKVEYTNNASNASPTWVEIAPATVKPNTGTYSWNPVPNALADLNNDNRIRISQKTPLNDHTLVLSVGGGTPFKIEPTLTVTVPAGGEGWNVGTSQTIKFKKKGAVQSVDVYYAYDGTTYTKLNTLAVDISGAPDANGEYSYSWAIPTNANLTIGNAGKIKVQVVAPTTQTAIAGISNGFQVKGTMALVGPTGASDLVVGGSKTIEWTPGGNISKFRIQYKTSAGGTYTEISPGGGCNNTCFTTAGANRTWQWTGIPNAIGNDVWFRVADYDNDNVAAVSAAANIIKGVLDLDSPDDTPLTYYIGDNVPISWNKTGSIGNIKITYSAKGDFTDTLVINGNYPSGSDGLNSLSPVWTVPSKVAETFKIRVTNNDPPTLVPPAGTELTDTSTAAFGVRPKVTGVSSPGSGNVWNVGDTTKVISWSATSATKTDNNLPKVKFQYLVSGGSWTDVLDLAGNPVQVDCANGTNNYTWVRGVADERSESVKIRAYFMDYAGTSEGFDSALFTIYPVITVTSPVGTDQLTVGTNYANLIRWTRTGTKSATFKVLYSTDGTTFPDPANLLADNQTVTNGTTGVTWNIPAATAVGPNTKIRVIDKDNTNVIGTSAAFKLKGVLALTNPATGDTWSAASTTNSVGWNFSGSIANVIARYDPNGGLGPDGNPGTADEYLTLIGTKPQTGNSGSSTLTWDMSPTGTNTTTVSNGGRIKIYDQADPNDVLATVDMKIGAKFEVLAPENGNICYAETSCAISWTPVAGTGVTDVKIEYTNNDSNASPTWVEIASGTVKANTGTYNWNPVPGAVADLKNDNRIRVSQKAPLNAAAMNAGGGTAFSIKPSLEITTPSAATTGPVSWDIGSTFAVKFKKKGAVQSVDLYYSYDGNTVNYVKVSATPIDISGAPDVNGEYTYNWNIGTSLTLTAGFTGKLKLKVVNPAEQVSVEGVQDNSLEVKGAVTLLNPNGGGGQTLTVGQTYAINGTVFGPITSVKLFYSTNGGSTYTQLDDGTNGDCDLVSVSAGAFSCNWVVQDLIGTNVKIKAEQANNSNVKDASDAALAIKGSVAIIAPVGPPTASIWYAGDPHDIAWTRNGSIGPIDLFYSVNDGSWQTIATGVASGTATGGCTPGPCYRWTVPGNSPADVIVSSNVKVKADCTNLTVPAITGAFRVKGKLILTYPDAAGLNFTLGDPLSISWTAKGDIGPVKVEYFDGAVWKTVTTGAPQNGPQPITLDAAFTVGNLQGTTIATNLAKVRITDADEATVTDESANAFMVKPLIQMLDPVGDDDAWLATSGKTISWNYKGTNVGNVKIEYSTDGGTNYTAITESEGAANDGIVTNDGGFSPWTVPNTPNPTFNKKFRISSDPPTDPWAVSATSGLFKIVGALQVTAPTSTDKWGVGTTQNVKWNMTGAINQVNLSYTVDGTNYNSIATGVSGSLGTTGYPWTMTPATTQVSTTARILVVDASDGSVSDVGPDSPSYFKIVPSLTITAPANDGGGNPARWAVDPPGCTPTPCTHQIQWTTLGQNTSVNLYYWKDLTCTLGGAGTSIVAGLGDTGAYNWQVPDPAELSTGPVCAKVRVTYPSDETVFDDSDSFRIVAGYRVLAPNGSADKWDVSSNQTIRWTSTTANVANARISYSTNGGASYPNELTTTANNTGAQGAERTWAWNVIPPTMTDQLKVKVEAANDANAFDESDSNAKIKAYVRVNQPSAAGILGTDGGVGLRVEDSYTITWTTDPGIASVPLVKLAYSMTPGNPASWVDILDGGSVTTPNDGGFLWTVPDAIAATLKVRVTSSTDPDAMDMSDNDFKIRGYFTLTRPNGAEQFKIYHVTENPNPENIQWATKGSITSVNVIAYSSNASDPVFRDGGGNVYTLSNPLVIYNGLANTANGNTSFGWQVPDKASPSVRVRISDPLDPTVVYRESAADFKVQGSVTVTYPDAANLPPLLVGDPATITWNKTGASITKVKISYSVSGGAFQPINESEEGTANDGIVTNDGSYQWSVADAISDNVILKIEDPYDAAVSDVSNNAFKIKPKFSWISPAGNDRWVVNESRILSWNTTGNVATVELVYSKDNFASSIAIASAVANVAGVNTRAWTIPNDTSGSVKVRVSKTGDSTAYVDSNTFRIEYYNITFEMRDQLSNAHISGLTVNGTNSTNPVYTWLQSAQNSPITKGLSAGAWNLTWTQQDYGDKPITVVVDSDKTVTTFLETKVVHVYESMTEIAYNPTTDKANFASTLRRDGITVPPGGLGQCVIELYDPLSGSPSTPFKTFTGASADLNGFYSFIWGDDVVVGQAGNVPTGLVSGRVYNVITKITMTTTGATFTTPRTFSITAQAQLQSVADTVKNSFGLSDTELQAGQNVKTILNGQTTTLSNMVDARLGFTAADLAAGKTMKSELTAQTTNINAATTNMQNTIQGEITNFRNQVNTSIVSLDVAVQRSDTSASNLEEAAEQSQESADALEVVGKKYSARLLLPTVVLVGENLPVRYRANEGLVPLIDIFTVDSDGKTIAIVKGKPMTENAENKGLYEFLIKVSKDEGFIPGKPATVFVKEDTTGNLEAGAIFIETTTLGTLEGLIAANSGSKAAIQETLAAVNAVKGTLATGGDVGRALELLRAKVERIPKAVAEEGGTVQMRKAVSEVAEKIKTLAGDEGYDLSQLVKKGMEESPSIKDIRKTTDEVQGATELMQVLMERKMGGIDAPVVHVLVE